MSHRILVYLRLWQNRPSYCVQSWLLSAAVQTEALSWENTAVMGRFSLPSPHLPPCTACTDASGESVLPWYSHLGRWESTKTKMKKHFRIGLACFTETKINIAQFSLNTSALRNIKPDLVTWFGVKKLIWNPWKVHTWCCAWPVPWKSVPNAPHLPLWTCSRAFSAPWRHK